MVVEQKRRLYLTQTDSAFLTVVKRCFVLLDLEVFTLRRKHMNRRLSICGAIAIGIAWLGLLAAGSNRAYGQAISGNLVGTVIDSSAAVVPNASVDATKLDTGASTTTTTNGTGAYRFENLPVGTYRIVVKSSGFKTAVQQVDVVLNQTGTMTSPCLRARPARPSKHPAWLRPSIQLPHNCSPTMINVFLRIWALRPPVEPVRVC